MVCSKLYYRKLGYYHYLMIVGVDIFSDISSFTTVKTNNIYDEVKHFLIPFDFSENPKTHPFYSEFNKKAIGKLKNEVTGKVAFD